MVSLLKTWVPLHFHKSCRVRYNSKQQIHLRATCATGVPAHFPPKPSITIQLAKCHFTLPIWITFPLLSHLLRLFLEIPAELFYQKSSQNSYTPSYSLPYQTSHTQKKKKNAVEAKHNVMLTVHQHLLASISCTVPSLSYSSNQVNPPYYMEYPLLFFMFVMYLLKYTSVE